MIMTNNNNYIHNTDNNNENKDNVTQQAICIEDVQVTQYKSTPCVRQHYFLGSCDVYEG